MTVILGLDIGSVRVGVAVADPDVAIPFPVAIWNRAGGQAEQEILKLIGERKVDLVIVGLPLNTADQRTPICDLIEAFMRRISKRASITIKYIDESYSSLEARESLSHRKSQKRFVDSEAACHILARYLENSKKRD